MTLQELIRKLDSNITVQVVERHSKTNELGKGLRVLIDFDRYNWWLEGSRAYLTCENKADYQLREHLDRVMELEVAALHIESEQLLEIWLD